MTNLRDGGIIVVGVASGPSGVLAPTGMTAAALGTLDQDHGQDWVNEYAER